MTTYVLVTENSPLRLWGLDSAQRLQRQLKEISKDSPADTGEFVWLQSAGSAPENSRVLVLNGTFLFENRTLKGLLAHSNHVLQHEERRVAAAFIDVGHVQTVLAHMKDPDQSLPIDLQHLQTGDMEAFDENLRRSTRPLLEPVNAARRTELENRLYGNAYRGITDLVTKFVWPRPARQVVHLCANWRISPNMVTSLGLVLVLAACYLFLHGYYGWGLLAGWVMTFLDTVDGKLARVTVQSSKFGHLFDHLIDLIHPPFWYIFWGMSLIGFQPVLGLELAQMYWIIVIAYLAGRAVEGLFPLLGDCSIFTWKPFDAWFRLVTARRNPCMILLTLGFITGQPEWAFIAVTFWSALTSVVLILRLLQATLVRMRQGQALYSWLSAEDVATGSNAFSFSVFGATRGAYARR